jgi:hypothetical protein
MAAKMGRPAAHPAGRAGYSGTPLDRKLGIKPGHTVLVSGEEPAGLERLLGLPESVCLSRGAAKADVMLHFTLSRAELRRSFRKLTRKLDPAGGLWVCWPKRASGVETDLTEDVVREIGLAAGLVDNKVCAVDETWSGLRLVYRLEDRPKLR